MDVKPSSQIRHVMWFSASRTQEFIQHLPLAKRGNDRRVQPWLPSETLLLQPNEIKTFATATLQASAEAMAFTLGTSTIEVVDDTGATVDQSMFP